MDDGRSRTLVLKRLDYTTAALPAASFLPFNISHTERLIFASSESDQRFIARPLVIIGPDNFKGDSIALVVMEDLAPRWARPRLHHDYALVVHRIDDIHDSMSRLVKNGLEGKRLIRYDEAFADPLIEFFERSIMTDISMEDDEELASLSSRWSDIKNALTGSTLPEVPSTFVHGDFVPAHIFIRWLPIPKIRLIDFEWLGFGPPHADLASLLKRARPSIERLSLRLYSVQHPDFSPDEHKFMYEWCQLCRGLLDAAYLVMHRKMMVPRKEPVVSRYARSSLRRTFLAAERLRMAR